jgi:release factor glutamine methyltransferase
MTAEDRPQPSYDQMILESGLPRLEARILLEHASGRTRSWLIAHGDEPARADTVVEFSRLAERRQRDGEPVAYLTGCREFHGLDLAVGPDVLSPRPETELLVDYALGIVADDNGVTCDPLRVLELGTGSGAIALAIAAARPEARIVATDRSEAALTRAQVNGSRLQLDQRIEWRLGDWWEAIGSDERFFMVLSNPPYIAERDPHLGQGDLRHEPIGALVSGHDGLDAIRTIAAGARAHLEDRGWLLLEHGFEQATQVRELLEQEGLDSIFTLRDLEGRERVTGGRWVLGPQDPPRFMV